MPLSETVPFLLLRILNLLDLDLAQIQRIQTRIHGIGGLDKLGVGCAGGQGVRREAVPCLGLLFQVLHSQRHHERLALGIAQTDDHKRGGHNDRPNRHQLAGAQTGIADQQ